MKYLIFFLSFSVFAFDPSKDPTIILDCDAPLLRADKTTPISISEIASYDWYISADAGVQKTWTLATNVTQSVTCQVVADLTQLSDNDYYYSPLVRDTGGRVGEIAYNGDPTEVVNVTVKRIANPGIPTGVRVILP